jgi:hypothetical protein
VWNLDYRRAGLPRTTWILWFAVGVSLLHAWPSAQTVFGVTELAEYRLGADVFVRFDRASRLIAAATRADPRFAHAPLFTQEVLVSGDVLPMAIGLEARLRNEPALAEALRTANLTPREYTKFALALVAARLAHGFLESGVLRSVPAGVHADNVMFVKTHYAEITAVMSEIGVE